MSFVSQRATKAGAAKGFVYHRTLYVMARLLAVGLVAKLLVRPLAPRWFMSAAELAAVQPARSSNEGGSYGIGLGGMSVDVVVAWRFVLLPIAWGLYLTLSKVGRRV